MPGASKRQPIVLTQVETGARERLRAHVQALAGTIGGRSAARPGSLADSVKYIAEQLLSLGYKLERQPFPESNPEFENVQAVLQGTAQPDRIIVIGAHYDTAGAYPGANDNASGVAAVLELARVFAKSPMRRTVRWVFFANEEPPYFQGPLMGSYVYAGRCHARGERVDAMISLETIGYYSDEPGSQQYPVGFYPGYPNRAEFLGFVSNVRSAVLLRRVLKAFRAGTTLPSEGAAAPAGLPGVGWSDHWSFWQFGYRAVMVTDTALYRYPHYHTPEDTPEKLDYDRMALALTGLAAVTRDLASQ
jgi:Zn-dependent M28 family amino/carboxypeptidase